MKTTMIAFPWRGAQLELLFSFPEGNGNESQSAQILPFPRPEWSDEEVDRLREVLLHQSLRMLTDGRCGAEVRQDVLEWMASDEVHSFSFVTCCEDAGCDPSELRAGVWAVLRRHERIGAGG